MCNKLKQKLNQGEINYINDASNDLDDKSSLIMVKYIQVYINILCILCAYIE